MCRFLQRPHRRERENKNACKGVNGAFIFSKEVMLMATPRRAIFLSLGMLLEKVDATPFIGFLITKAKLKNASFVLTPEIKSAAFELAEQLNQEKILPMGSSSSKGEESKAIMSPAESKMDESPLEAIFRKELTNLFGLKNVDAGEFWAAWDNMVVVGEIAKKIKLLQDAHREHKEDSFELYTDSNYRHLSKIAKVAADSEAKMTANFDRGLLIERKETTFADFPLSATCITKQDIASVINDMILRATGKVFNKPEKIILFFGDPENMIDKDLRLKALEKLGKIRARSEGVNIDIVLQNRPIEEMLQKLYPVVEKVPAPSMAPG